MIAPVSTLPKGQYFVTGTDTGIGKTALTCSLLKLWGNAGALKPVESGLAPVPPCISTDNAVSPEMHASSMHASSMRASSEVLSFNPVTHSGGILEEGSPRTLQPAVIHSPLSDFESLARLSCDDFCRVLPCTEPQKWTLPLSPFDASFHYGEESFLPERSYKQAILAKSLWPGPLLVEGAGGLLTPLTESFFIADLAVQWGLSLLIVVPNRLGCINHTLLTLKASKYYNLEIAGIILNNGKREEDDISSSKNGESLSYLVKDIDVYVFDHDDSLSLYDDHIYRPKS